MDEEKIKEQRLQIMQQYGVTEEQLDCFFNALQKVVEVVAKIVNAAWEVIKENYEALAAALREHGQSIDADTFAEMVEKLQGAIVYESSPPPYDRADTRNGYYSAKLASYKRNSSAAIRRPRRTARSCC